jgi:hypothetical protein
MTPSPHFRNGPAKRRPGSATADFLQRQTAYDPQSSLPKRSGEAQAGLSYGRFPRGLAGVPRACRTGARAPLRPGTHLAWPSLKTAVEVEGSTFSRSRHTSGVGFRRDCEKYNAATAAGWRVLRFTTEMLRDDPDGAVELVIAVMNGKGAVEVQP